MSRTTNMNFVYKYKTLFETFNTYENCKFYNIFSYSLNKDYYKTVTSILSIKFD